MVEPLNSDSNFFYLIKTQLRVIDSKWVLEFFGFISCFNQRYFLSESDVRGVCDDFVNLKIMAAQFLEGVHRVRCACVFASMCCGDLCAQI